MKGTGKMTARAKTCQIHMELVLERECMPNNKPMHMTNRGEMEKSGCHIGSGVAFVHGMGNGN